MRVWGLKSKKMASETKKTKQEGTFSLFLLETKADRRWHCSVKRKKHVRWCDFSRLSSRCSSSAVAMQQWACGILPSMNSSRENGMSKSSPFRPSLARWSQVPHFALFFCIFLHCPVFCFEQTAKFLLYTMSQSRTAHKIWSDAIGKRCVVLSLTFSFVFPSGFSFFSRIMRQAISFKTCRLTCKEMEMSLQSLSLLCLCFSDLTTATSGKFIATPAEGSAHDPSLMILHILSIVIAFLCLVSCLFFVSESKTVFAFVLHPHDAILLSNGEWFDFPAYSGPTAEEDDEDEAEKKPPPPPKTTATTGSSKTYYEFSVLDTERFLLKISPANLEQEHAQVSALRATTLVSLPVWFRVLSFVSWARLLSIISML